jgi:hypothetical protein
VKTQDRDWDPEERDALKNVTEELDALRARHASDPLLELLRAARSEGLPEELQDSIGRHLSENAWSRAMVEGADAVDVSLSLEDQNRLLDRIRAETIQPRRAVWNRLWIPALATAAIGVLVVVVVRRADQGIRPIEPGTATSATATPIASAPPMVPRFQLALDKPDVKLSPGAMTYRGNVGDKGFLVDVKPALDAYRLGDYAGAEREFSALAPRYLQSVEIAFYQGVARLFLNDLAGADAALATAENLNETTFAADVAWYRAIVDERAGRLADARTRLAALCREGGHARQAQACDAATRLK